MNRNPDLFKIKKKLTLLNASVLFYFVCGKVYSTKMSRRLLVKYLNEFKGNGLEIRVESGVDGMFCTFCNKKISGHKKNLVQQHINTFMHKSIANRIINVEVEVQETVESDDPESDHSFVLDMGDAFVSANIPFWKMENKKMKYKHINIEHSCEFVQFFIFLI